MFQSHIQTIRPMTSAHLAQTMTLLSLTSNELRQQIDAELASNPALELIDEHRCPTCHRLLIGKGPCPICSQPQSSLVDEPIVFISSRDDFSMGGGLSPEDLPEDNFATATEDLPAYVLRQIAPELSVADRPIAAYILTHLDEDGFLTIELVEVARYYHIPMERVQRIIHLIQRSDPIGVGSSGPKEALLIQVDVLSETKPVPPLTRQAVENGLGLLSHHQFSDLAHQLKTSLREIQEIAHFISENLNPFPARSHWGDNHESNEPISDTYHQPDIIISYLNDCPNNSLVVEIILPYFGTLRVNPLFRQAIRQVTNDKKEDWKNDLERAALLVKCLQQRNHTMRKLMQRIVSLQQDFILKGETYLKPVTRAQISRELDVHESTISRAVSSKIVQLPNRRIVPLSIFFDRSLNVRSILRNIIVQENHPLSDSELVNLLSIQGYNVARRTVAKYRAMEGILPAHLRRPYLSPSA
jgi:RNA polymerase sigma-54 factor